MRSRGDVVAYLIAALAAVSTVSLVVIGATAAVNMGDAARIGAEAADWLVWFLIAGAGALAALVVLWVARLVVLWTWDYLQVDVVEDDAPYLPFLGLAAGLLAGAATLAFTDSALAVVLVGATVGLTAVGGGLLVAYHPVVGTLLWVGLPMIVVALVLAAGGLDPAGWPDRPPRDWLLLFVATLLVVGVPATVVAVERTKWAPTWQLQPGQRPAPTPPRPRHAADDAPDLRTSAPDQYI